MLRAASTCVLLFNWIATKSFALSSCCVNFSTRLFYFFYVNPLLFLIDSHTKPLNFCQFAVVICHGDCCLCSQELLSVL